jgi:excisionase family DNA binding protein
MSKDKSPMVVTLDTEQLAAIIRQEVRTALAEQAVQKSGMDPVLTTEEAAEFLKMPVNVLRKRARAGELPSFKIGALFRFRASELNAWMATQPRVKKAG